LDYTQLPRAKDIHEVKDVVPILPSLPDGSEAAMFGHAWIPVVYFRGPFFCRFFVVFFFFFSIARSFFLFCFVFFCPFFGAILAHFSEQNRCIANRAFRPETHGRIGE
jgi:hypothetical protein